MTQEPTRWRKPDDVAAELGITRHQLSRLVTTHNIPVIRVNRRDYRFDPAAVVALEEACRVRKAEGDQPLARYRSPALSIPPVRSRDVEFAKAQALITKRLREKKRQRKT